MAPDKIVFIAWSRLSRRTRDLARELGAKLVFIPDHAPYLRAWRETGKILASINPRAVIAQLPQGPLLWRAHNLSKKQGFRLIADMHTGFIVYSSLKERLLNQPFRHLLRQLHLVIAHNEPIARLLTTRHGIPQEKVLIVYDPLPKIPGELRKPQVPGLKSKYLVAPSSWAPDEPLEQLVHDILRENPQGDGIQVVITGDPGRGGRRARRILEAAKKDNRVIITGYLPVEEYYWLLKNSEAVIALTKREYTVLSAIWEAVALSKPFITTPTTTLRKLLGENYPCFYRPGTRGLGEAAAKCRSEEKRVKNTIDMLRLLSKNSIEKLKQKLEEVMHKD